MSVGHTIGNALDKAIGIFAPKRALQRMVSRAHANDFQRRMYAAGRPTEDAGGWVPLDGDANAPIRQSSRMVRARIRQLVRDFPYFDRAVRLRTAFIVGTGIRLQVRMYDNKDRLDRVLNQRIENEWMRWAEHADTTGKLSFADLQALAERQRCECGEYIFLKRLHKGQYRLQPIEPDRLVSFGANPAPGNDIEQGIEYDKATGTPLFYWFEEEGLKRRTIRVPSSQVIHGYTVLRPGQMRGISPLTSCVMVAGDLAELLDSELEATRIQSKYLGFVRSNDPAGFANVREGSPKADKRRVEHLGNATLEYLRAGDEITLASINRQGSTFEPFIKFNLRTLAVGSMLTYELLSGNYDLISYSNLRGIRLDLSVTLRPEQQGHIDWLCRPTFGGWVEWQSLVNPALFPPHLRLAPWNQVWIGPGQEPADPLKEIKALADEMRLGVRSPQEWAARRGRDLEEILDEIKEAQIMAKERGLTLGDVNSTMKSNPAALMGKDGK